MMPVIYKHRQEINKNRLVIYFNFITMGWIGIVSLNLSGSQHPELIDIMTQELLSHLTPSQFPFNWLCWGCIVQYSVAQLSLGIAYRLAKFDIFLFCNVITIGLIHSIYSSLQIA